MRKNRKMPKRMSVVATNSMRLGTILVFFAIMVILNVLSASSCTQLMKTKGTLERTLVKLEDSRQRESTRWQEMTTPENLQKMLSRHGLKMTMPRPEQSLRMRQNGSPAPGQLALERAKRRLGESTASYSTSSKSRRRMR